MIVDQKLNKQFLGVYLIDGDTEGTQLATTSKPNWFRRVCTRLFLGWKWINIKKLKSITTELKATAEAAKLVEATNLAEESKKSVKNFRK